MRKTIFLLLLPIILLGCGPVIKEELMKSASTNVPFAEMKKKTDTYKGKLYVLGGLVVGTKFTEDESVIEAAYITVDKKGYLKKTKPSNIRFLATLPKEKGILDPVLYKRGSEITVAGEFTGTRTEEIEKMSYAYPVFEVKEIYLWEERAEHEGMYGVPAYTYPYYPYMWGWWDPWGWGPPVFIVPREKKK